MPLPFAALVLLAGPPRFLGPPEKKPPEGEPAAVAPGDPAPPFSGAVQNASAAGLRRFELASSIRAGGPTLISFFDPRCAACADELPVLDSLYTQYRERGLRLVSIAADPKALLRQRQVGWPVLADSNGAITRKYLGRNPRYPAAVILGRDGRVASVKKGYRGDPSILLRAEAENALR